MLKTYILLYYEFFKTGIFAVGGGYATLPFLYYMQTQYNWFSADELTNMLAVSNITPGPIGVNMATYAGYTTGGFFGSLLATTAIMTGPFIIVYTIIKIYNKFKSLQIINDIFLGLRPAACALLFVIGLQLLTKLLYKNGFEIQNILNIDVKSLILFLTILIPSLFFKKNPALIIFLGAIGGILINNIF
jgi:chromate transporter